MRHWIKLEWIREELNSISCSSNSLGKEISKLIEKIDDIKTEEYEWDRNET